MRVVEWVLIAQNHLSDIIEVSKPLLKKGKVIYMAHKSHDMAHTKLMCKYHIVFTPKYRRKVIYNQYKESIRDILKQLCSYKGVDILEGELMPDHIHMLVSILSIPEHIPSCVRSLEIRIPANGNQSFYAPI